MTDSILRIGLAAVRNAPSVAERLETVKRFLEQAAVLDVAIVCFPEAYLPGLRGLDFPVPDHDQRRQQEALEEVRVAAEADRVATVIGMEGNPPPGSTTSRSSSPATARSSATRRRIRFPRRRTILRARRTAPAVRGRWGPVRDRHLPRGVALPGERALGGDSRRPSRLPPAAHRQRLHWHDHRTLGIPARPTTRRPWWRVASRTRSISPVSITRCATKTRRPVCSVPRGVPGACALQPGTAAGARHRPVAGNWAMRPALQPGPLSVSLNPPVSSALARIGTSSRGQLSATTAAVNSILILT